MGLPVAGKVLFAWLSERFGERGSGAWEVAGRNSGVWGFLETFGKCIKLFLVGACSGASGR